MKNDYKYDIIFCFVLICLIIVGLDGVLAVETKDVEQLKIRIHNIEKVADWRSGHDFAWLVPGARLYQSEPDNFEKAITIINTTDYVWTCHAEPSSGVALSIDCKKEIGLQHK